MFNKSSRSLSTSAGEDEMSWHRDGQNRRVVNSEIGAALSEGRMWAGDRQYHLEDLNGNFVLSFYVTEESAGENFRTSAPIGTNYCAEILVTGLSGLKSTKEISISGANLTVDDVLDIIRRAVTASVGGYETGGPNFVLVRFVEFGE
jgi:hypothetical protein